ncbi:hypothetical protein UA08_02728 [Talaromyces atroroseus]|uniref:Uncharacterized protein n=1 Tax=Talaromyces atroroseus TaxID=1441469 RepID=A0A225AKJ8_TALAT|nr:hypothetical protein UA08_02728 [Talaromyces atroroseus]OKL62081.1 hypothetical protein UA08_02728 [Talaromyces atroroseus]
MAISLLACLLFARERFVAIFSKILSRRQIRTAQAAEYDNDGANANANAKAMDGIIAKELLEIDQWILTFNMYLSHNNPMPQTCDSRSEVYMPSS